MKRITITVLAALVLLGAALTSGRLNAAAPATASTGPLVLENPRIAVEIDRQNGAICSIRDKDQDAAYRVSGIGLEVTTGAGSIRAEHAVETRIKRDGVDLRFAGSGLDIALHYRLGADDHFIEKWLEITSTDGKPYSLKSVFLEDMTTEAFSEIHFHDDQTIWHCPINLFLRGEKGGCFAGLEYPYWDLKQKGKEGFRLGYQPNYQAAAGETNISEKYFIGVYRKEGISRRSQGPYPGRGRSSLVNFSQGLSQHFKGKRIPPVVEDVPLEVLDWGEVWAMQEFMRHVLPDDLPLPEEGYWIWQNGWWAGLFDPKPEILDQLKQAGIHDIMTAHTWYGRGYHPVSPPYIDRMRTEPMGFPKDNGIAGMSGPAGPAAGLHTKHAEVQLDKFVSGEFTPEFVAPPAMEAFRKYGQQIGVHVSSFSVPSMYFHKHPEWASIDESGKVSEYLFGRKVSCPACDPYMDHMLRILDHVFTKYKPRWWGFDGRWLSHWEVGAYRPGPKGAGLDPCYAEGHGHLPGDNLYKEWKNILTFLQKLRQRHPHVCLESYYGLHRGGPWTLRHLNSAYHYFETHGADMNRLQAWHQQNDRFRPVYKNTCDLFGNDPKSFRFNVISALSMSTYCMVGPAFKGLPLKENRDFLMKWRAWATENHDFLKVKRDLFDCPGDSLVDGSAHIIKDRGYLFLFPGGFDKQVKLAKMARASIPINRWLQLDANPEALYQIKEVYPREGADLGIYKYGEDFLHDVPQDTPVVLALEPAPAGSKPRRPALQNQPDTLVVPAFENSMQQASADLYRHDKSGKPEAAEDSSQSSIINGTDWFDNEGRLISAHEGDIARFNGVFYWYGSSYANNPRGRFDIADGPVWNGVQVYRSTDLKNWTYKGVALPRPENGWGELGATGRAHVIYNDKTKKFVMWYRWYLHMPASFLMVAVADHPEGPFTSLGPREMGTSNGFASDMNVFKDDDGKVYVIYCDHETEATKFAEHANGRYAVRIDSLTGDYLDSNKDGVYAFDKGVEAPSMIKYKGKYIAIGSGVHGWAGSETVCSVADSPLGTYVKRENISEKKTWDSQVTDLIYLKESDTVMALCDQWWIPDKTDINKSRYLLLPVYFDPQTGVAKMTFHEKWNPFSQPNNERD